MGKKYFCWNIDDGLEQDKKIVDTFRKCGIGATFNLNSGMFGKKQMIGRMGNYGIRDVPLEDFDEVADLDTLRQTAALYMQTDTAQVPMEMLGYHNSFRIPLNEIKDVYSGFELASHGFLHENFSSISEKEARESIKKDVDNLSILSGRAIKGFAYPYGAVGEKTVQQLKEQGICYARTTEKAEDFSFPTDLMHIKMTGWCVDGDIYEKIKAFLQADAKEDQFFLMFAHGYEFDFNTADSNWDKFHRICDMVADREDVICCSTAEALLRQ